jgi:hypothetical protein
LKEKPPDGWSSLSPLTVLPPSKPRLILACIVGIKIDVQARYSTISKLEDILLGFWGSPVSRLCGRFSVQRQRFMIELWVSD